MGNINVPKVIVGGLVAGVVMTAANYIYNQLLFAEQGAEMFARLGIEQPGGSQIAVFIVMTFIIGIALVWLYAAIRPRFGAGVQTAVIAGVTMWVFSSLLTTISFAVLGIFATSEIFVPLIFDLVTAIVAAIAGAWLYQEGTSAAA